MTGFRRPEAEGAPRWAAAIASSRGLRRWLLAFAGGALAALALPPVHAIPLLLPAFAGLALLMSGADGGWRGFATGWFFGLGFFVAGLHWLGLPMVVDIPDDAAKDLVLAAGLGGTALLGLGLPVLVRRLFGAPGGPWRRAFLHGGAWLAAFAVWMAAAFLFVPARFGWMVPLAVYGLSAGLALFPALAMLAVGRFRLQGIPLLLAVPLAWLASEWVRGHVLSGFPWNLVATAWTPVEPMIQSAAWTGAYGLGFLTVMIATLPAALAMPMARPARFGAAAAAALLLAALWTAGAIRLPAGPVERIEGVWLRIVQPSIPQSLKWDRAAAARNLARHMDLSLRSGERPVTHVIWPETATGFVLTTTAADPGAQERAARFREHIARIVPRDGALITGAVRADPAAGRIFNSVQVLTADGRVTHSYDKHHLVPFGEYVPARGLLGALGLERLAAGQGDFGSGPGPRALDVAGLPSVSPLICYEAIFPAEAVPAGERPGWMLNVTNDGWFGTSAGPYQHFASARLRAVEQGLPLVRAANTGISAIVDPYGRVERRLGLNQVGIIDAGLPYKLSHTLYARLGDWVLLAYLIFVMAAIIWSARRGES